ncbi:MAG: hypothetical protein S0880_34230 [Actinomycetota bacterium]|nr:hypothetical protein [Actinomycetota bacterium]
MADCEAMLTGAAAERLMRTGRPVPPWAWVNLLAHGSAADLRRPPMMAASLAERPWCRARAHLAGQLARTVDADVAPLARLQREVLVPLELALLDDPSIAPSPTAVVHLVLRALDPHGRLRRH